MDKKRIMLVEDEAVTAMDLKSNLIHLGYEIPAIVSSGEEAIRAAADVRPDLVLMDIALDGPLNGIDAAAEIRRLHNIPVIFLTAHIDSETTENAIKTAPFGYLLKPVDIKSLAIMIDIAIYKSNAEARIRESEERYRQLVELAMSVILRWDTRGTVTFINECGASLFGYRRDELLGRNIMGTIVDEKDSTGKDLRAMIEKIVLEPQQYLSNENENTTKDGRHLWMHWRNSAVFDNEGTVVEILSIGNDLTEQKRMEAELRRHREQLMNLVDERTAELKHANKELRREIAARERMEGELLRADKLESVGILAGGIAHDFNNLLNTILGNISMAMLDLDTGQNAYRRLVGAERASLRAQDLTHQLLTFSKGGAPIKQTTSLGDLIRESATFALRGSRARHDIAIPDDLWLVDADEGQISQVVNNLMINADQAMPEGGTISVRCENLLLSGGSHPVAGAGRYVKVTVQDSGVGIPKEHLSKIFDPYFTTKQRGSGLGLATTYAVIQKHGGNISVESELGVGSAFTILLPAADAVQTTKVVENSRLKKGSGKILLMDDDEGNRQTVGEALEMLGYAVSRAEDGNRTIALYQEAMHGGAPFDVVIMDLTIPGGMGGQETIKRLVKIDPQVKAIVSSGYSNDPIMANYRSYGFIAVMAKPFRLKQLSETVYQAMMNGKEGPGDESPSANTKG